ncbi:MAG: hypothetical protein ACM37W_25140 [Actinomycetota bacterium]
MKTLLTLFGQERSFLQTELDKATNIDQVVKLVQSRIDTLEKVYLGDLNIAQVRLASLFLDTLRQSIATLTAANLAQVATVQTAPSVEQVKQLASPRSILKVLQILLCMGILGSLFSLVRTGPAAWMAILLTAVLVGVEVVLQLDNQERSQTTSSAQLQKMPQPALRVDSQVLLDNLADALNTIDEAVARAKDTQKPLDASGIEELPELLQVIQRLMGASFLNKPQMAIEVAKLLPQVLREQGIRAEVYQLSGIDSDRTYFDFEPSIDRSAKEFVTVTPALLKGDRLLLKGRVIEPPQPQA